MKRLLKIAPIAGLLLAIPFLSGFTDLPEEHWAYSAVQQLSDEGTVSGFTDGTFRPNDPVTRAQFVKMLGYRTEEARNDHITDLSQEHWAYDVLIHSPLRLEGRNILPDDLMTQEQVAVYIYDCLANGEDNNAPSVITDGVKSPSEIGWIYEHGIMVGDDGLNLRLSDGLTRAEAAMLIVNARQRVTTITDFADNVSDEILKQIFNGSALFDAEYSRDEILTNGQLARAAYRLRLDCVDALWYNGQADFEHEYANDLKAMEAVLGSGRISSEFADAPAMQEDAFAMLAYGVASKIHTPVSYGNKGDYYKDAELSNQALDIPLTFAWQNGIKPYGGGILKSGTPVTHKLIAAVLLQYDMRWGLQTSVTTDGENITYNDEAIRYSDLPENTSLFQSIPASIPNDVIDLPFRSVQGNEIQPLIAPHENYSFCNDLRDAFVDYLSALSSQLFEKTGVKVKFTYYPQLVYDNNSGLTVRVKAETVNTNQVSITAEQLFDGFYIYTDAKEALSTGDIIWTEIPLSYTFFAGDET